MRLKTRFVESCLPLHDSSSSPGINMDLNRTQTPTNDSCIYLPPVKWDLNDPTTYLSLVAVNIIVSPTTVLLNALVMVILTKRKELQRRSNILLFNLAITDLLVGALCMPLTTITDVFIFGHVSPENGFTVAFVNITIFDILTWASLFNLTVMAWERYVAIRKWMDYKNILTKGRLKKLATVCWLLAIFLGVQFPPTVTENVTSLEVLMLMTTRDYLTIVAGLCVPVSIIYLYLMVYLGIRQQKQSAINQATAQAKVKLQCKVAKTCALITFVLFITYGQRIIITALDLPYPIFYWLSRNLLQLNSLFDPLIYCFTDHRLRNAMLVFLKIKKPQAIQPTAGVVRFERKKESLSPKDIPEKRPRFTRSTSCNTVPALDSAYARSSEKLLLKRSLSLPSLSKGSGLFVSGSQMKQPMSITTTTATIHVESRSRFGKNEGPFSPKTVAETPLRLARSASCNTVTPLDCAAKVLKRSMTVPSPGEHSSSFKGSQLTFYPGSGSRFAEKEGPLLPKTVTVVEAQPRLTRSASICCMTGHPLDSSHAKAREKALQRSMSVPSFIENSSFFNGSQLK